MVFDETVEFPGCDWTEQHTAQGFARRESVVNFSTLLEFGYADVTINIGKYEPHPDHQRVIAVPFLITSGRVLVEGPEETDAERNFTMPPGNYRLVAAQHVTADDQEVIVLCFEPLTKALARSAVLVADEALNPPMPLIETAEIAGLE